MNNKLKIIIVIFFGLSCILIFGIKIPPKHLKATELSMVHSVESDSTFVKWSQKEFDYWNSLQFQIATKDYPGETPDYVIKLKGTESDFSAMYNKNDTIVFFSFSSEIKYGFLNTPPPGGWTQPLYKIKADEKILNLLRIK